MPIRALDNAVFDSEGDIVSAIDWARTHGANVISMSWHWDGPHTNGDAAFDAAHAAGLVLVAAAGNGDMSGINYPASHQYVMAVGASDKADRRKSLSSPDGELWGSQYGQGLSVMAPGVQCFTTDQTGAAGFNDNGGAAITWACVNYGSSGSADGNYVALMNGTSAATPHVAGLAGLLFSLYPTLTNGQVRTIIEQTAEKVGGYTYMEDVSNPNGSWAEEMGYGRINVLRALDHADTYIKDAPADDGTVPFTSEPFWDASDIVVRPSDDDIFASHAAIRGQTNYIYARVTNRGPADARNVSVAMRAVAFTGTEFVFPSDWTSVDATHVQPTSVHSTFPLLPAGAQAIAKFSVDSTQVDALYGWETGGWHACLLAEVTSDNDYGTPVGVHTWENNNLAQRNISTIAASAGSSISYPFVTGNRLNRDLYMEIAIDRSELPREAELLLNPSERSLAFPALGDVATHREPAESATLLEPARIALTLAGATGTLTLPAGTAIEGDTGRGLGRADNALKLAGAEWVSRGGQELIAITADRATIGLQKRGGELRQMSLGLQVPRTLQPGETLRVRVAQLSARHQPVGGVTLQVEVI